MEQSLTKETASTRAKYDRNSKWYNVMEFPMEMLWYRRWRRRLFARLEGKPRGTVVQRGKRTLEVGVGTGKNLPFYRDNLWHAGVDFSEGMLSRARPIASKRKIALVQGDAQQLPFEDAAFDAVFATFVFCSVPDPALGLREIRRVLKPGGQLLLLEHVLPENRYLAKIFNKLNRLTVEQAGVHINRRTAANIRKAGFALQEETNLLSTIFKFFVAKPG
jgi:ubiquinone/menaquinone biosynthesis C-methylase UbiE